MTETKWEALEGIRRAAGAGPADMAYALGISTDDYRKIQNREVMTSDVWEGILRDHRAMQALRKLLVDHHLFVDVSEKLGEAERADEVVTIARGGDLAGSIISRLDTDAD